jgi:hypothetical protein
MNTSSASSSSSQLKTIVTLFAILRVTILLMYTPQGLLNAYTDYQHYYRVAQLSDEGYHPFVNLWYEYPPLTTYLSEGVYWLTRNVLPPGDLESITYQIYARLLAAVFLCFETGVVILLHRLATRLWDMERANWLGWVYATLGVPLFYWNTSQNSVVAFFTLLAVAHFLETRQISSAVALGLGIAAKFTPVFMLGPVTRFLLPDWRRALRYGLIVIVIVGAIFAPFVLLGGGPWVAASFVTLSRLASWSTPWALIDGNWNPGDAGPLSTRFDLAAIYHLPGNPPIIPSWLTIIVFGAIYLWLFRRPIDLANPRHFLWFSALTLLIFVLWSKGWSPQWATLIIPFVLLSFPNQRGLALVLALTAILFIEWPLSDALKSTGLLAVAVLARTALFIVMCVMLFRTIWPRDAALSAAVPHLGKDYIS